MSTQAQTIITATPAAAKAATAPAAPKGSLHLVSPGISLGCDPELFLVDAKGRIVGSERVLPKETHDSTSSRVVPDGVQVELHPEPGSCRAGLSGQIAAALNILKGYADTYNADNKDKVHLNFDQVVRVRKAELNLLSPKSQHLGCGPSKSAYGTPPVEVDGMIYRKRSAAGHIHLGTSLFTQKALDPERTVRLLDIIVGATCVLIEPDHDAARERRKNYGRAGEYRIPAHGLEYRTLSNFWLRSYPLMSLVMALSRQALGVAYGPYAHKTEPNTYTKKTYLINADEALLSAAPAEMVQECINKSDIDLARQIFEGATKPLLFERIQGYEGLNYANLKDFEFFMSKPFDKWFGKDPFSNWQHRRNGWESFLQHEVRPKRFDAESAAAAKAK